MRRARPGHVLLALARARRTATLYGADHSVTAGIVAEAVEALRTLLAGRPPLSLVLHEETFYAGKTLLLEESLRLSVLPDILRERGITSLEFQEGVGERDVVQLIDVLNTPARRLQQAGGAQAALAQRRVGRITIGTGPPPGTVLGDEVRVDPADVYRAGLRVVLDLYAQAARGAPLDLRKATVLIVSLLDALSEDRTGLQAMGATRAYDEATAHHPVQVAVLSLLMGLELGLQRPLLIAAGLAALVHDIGHVRVPWETLTGDGTPGPAAGAEAAGDAETAGAGAADGAALRLHPLHGAYLLRGLAGLSRLAMVVAFEHHAYRNGSGYPPMGAGAVLHPLTRLVQAADVYDAATSSARADRRPMPPPDALRFVRDGAGRLFDAEAAAALERVVGRLPATDRSAGGGPG